MYARLVSVAVKDARDNDTEVPWSAATKMLAKRSISLSGISVEIAPRKNKVCKIAVITLEQSRTILPESIACSCNLASPVVM